MVEPRKIFGGLGNRMFQGAYIYSQFLDGNIPDIYLQDEKYFEKHKGKIKEFYGTDIVKSDYVSLHVRRGDYVGNLFYVDLTQTDYYDKAIAEFPNEKFMIFCADRQRGSNDVSDKLWCWEWAKRKGIKFELWNGKNEVDDMNAMIGCKGKIMANSSFSWWGAYLGEGKVVAPKNWFSDGLERVKLLDEWIKL